MAPKYWMISNRNVIVAQNTLGVNQGGLTYWVTEASTGLDRLSTWTKVSPAAFRGQLIATAQGFPSLLDSSAEDQKHTTLYVHGYNNTWQDAVRTYQALNQALFEGDSSLGVCVLFTWPSKGSPAAYLPDRQEVEASAGDLADVLTLLYNYLENMEIKAAEDPSKACRAKTSIIAHSMGNYLVQKAAKTVWTRKNQPLLVSLLSQLLMLAADVDNDLFKSGEQVDKSDGDALANLTYRITAFYTGLDQVLGASAGLKHFGKRRLGRSGLDRTVAEPDNVWDIDCTRFFANDGLDPIGIHSAYFVDPDVLNLMRQVLRGVDRTILTFNQGLVSSALRSTIRVAAENR
jgi:esterase/lipase superfamily enzyme